ncbi:FANCL ligase, partial [Polypterus senegalus]
MLESLKQFWDVMDEIDEQTWVLEPEKPTRSATMRRIAIGNVNIRLRPNEPEAGPSGLQPLPRRERTPESQSPDVLMEGDSPSKQ